MKDLSIIPMDIRCRDAQTLLSALNARLIEITGTDGTAHFSESDLLQPGSLFLIAYLNDTPVGCGAIRRVSDDTAEVKRVYAADPGRGIGRCILRALETHARAFGYTRLILATRQRNTVARAFYTAMGFTPGERYGSYTDSTTACCYEKQL